MNYRLNVSGWKRNKDPDQDPADTLASYHWSKYPDAYRDFLQRISGRGHSQIMLIDLDNQGDSVIIDDSRWEETK